MGRLAPPAPFADHTRAELAELLARTNASAKRATPVVEHGSDDMPSAWTMWHRSLDLLLTELEHTP